MLKTRLHAIAGTIAFLTILTFWLSTVVSEIFGDHGDIAYVKNAVLWGMIVLIPCLAATGASGFSLGKKRKDPRVTAKQKRMPVIALNGIVVLIPCAVFLADRSGAGMFDTAFYGVQAIELIAGAINLRLMGLNIRDGFALRKPLPRDEAATG